MSFFSQTVAARLAGDTVRAERLLLMDWLPTASRYWDGLGPLVTPDGNSWDGCDGVIAIEGLDYALGTAAPKATISVSAMDPNILTLAQTQAANVKNRAATIYLQYFDANQQPLDNPYPLWVGLMDVMTYRFTREGVYTVSVSVEGLWTRRNRPANGYYDVQDQAARGFPTDTGLDQIPALAGQSILWKTT